jgi:hypothetical protein
VLEKLNSRRGADFCDSRDDVNPVLISVSESALLAKCVILLKVQVNITFFAGADRANEFRYKLGPRSPRSSPV